MNICIYDAESCEILRTVVCPPSQSWGQSGNGELSTEVDECVTDATHYIRDGQAVEKQALSPSVLVGGFSATVTGLPADLRVSLDGADAMTDGDPLELEFDEPGTYTLRINGGAPYISTEVEITIG